MREIYRELFCVSQEGKIRERTMVARIASSAAIIIACLFAMCITAYAYFSYNISSTQNYVKTANFETVISVYEVGENGTLMLVPATLNYGDCDVPMEAGKQYVVTVSASENSTAKTGFMVVKAAGCSTVYHTQQLGKSNLINGQSDTVTFVLVPTDNTVVSFLAHWGTSSYYDAYNQGDDGAYITNSVEPIKMIVNGITDIPVKDENKTEIPETTAAPETTRTPEPDEFTAPLSTEENANEPKEN